MHGRTGSRLRKNLIIYTLNALHLPSLPSGLGKANSIFRIRENAASPRARLLRKSVNGREEMDDEEEKEEGEAEPAKRIGCNFARWHRAMHELDQPDLSINCGLYKTGKKREGRGEREEGGIVPFSLPRYILHERCV